MGAYKEAKVGWAQYWEKKRKEVKTTVTIDWYDKRLRVSCPYDTEFIAMAHKYQGRWRPRSKSWSFRMSVGHIIIPRTYTIFAGLPIVMKRRDVTY